MSENKLYFCIAGLREWFMTNSWDSELNELAKRQKLAEKMGGPDKLKRQKERGKLNVRERMDQLLDKDSFREIGKIAGKGTYDAKGDLRDFSPSNFIFGLSLIHI